MSLNDFLCLVSAAIFAVGFPVLVLWLRQKDNERQRKEWEKRTREEK